ncbi:hypothetical protein [Desulfovibrio legallii]|uniref:phosphoserine phosphatase n=1 Tax=Desulfovibrio legallii TaxID=571438 RepID=A0A1G7N1I5_9BACT|nr:hypothetical protein [Desulfovibrio legallii]SDF67955.1 hypothetical protein SAMN05192586_11067 [Desulfovibrio legallii]
MVGKRKSLCAVLVLAGMLWAGLAAAANPIMLQSERWEPTVRQSINEMFVLYGKGSPGYNPSIRPYAVFDFDNTVSILDVEEQLAIYQLENLRFAVPPEQMYAVLTTGVPDVNKDLGKDWGGLTVATVAADAAAAYKRLYAKGYVAADGSRAAGKAAWMASDDWKEFAAKARWLYDAIGDTMDVSVSYPWITYWFTGMTPQQVYDLAHEAFTYYAKASSEKDFWRKITWKSPAAYAGSKAGPLSISFKQGITVSPEMRELFHALEANGFDAWVCSASFIDVISAAVSPEVFGIEGVDGVLAMTNKEKNGRYINAYDYDFHAQTQGKGKTESISKLILPLYRNRGPVFVAFDSQGDFNFVSEYADTALGLALNRARKDDAGILAAVALYQNGKKLTVAEAVKQGQTRYVLQGRNENGGYFWPRPEVQLLGKDKPVLLSAKAEGWLQKLREGVRVPALINDAPRLTGKLKTYDGYKSIQ